METENKTMLQELVSELTEIKETKCKTIIEMFFFDGVLSIIESKYLEKEEIQINNLNKLKQEHAEMVDMLELFIRENYLSHRGDEMAEQLLNKIKENEN